MRQANKFLDLVFKNLKNKADVLYEYSGSKLS